LHIALFLSEFLFDAGAVCINGRMIIIDVATGDFRGWICEDAEDRNALSADFESAWIVRYWVVRR
jgi:hypothetical protein